MFIFFYRFECVECGMTTPLLSNLRRHITKTHQNSFSKDVVNELAIDEQSEAWVSIALLLSVNCIF